MDHPASELDQEAGGQFVSLARLRAKGGALLPRQAPGPRETGRARAAERQAGVLRDLSRAVYRIGHGRRVSLSQCAVQAEPLQNTGIVVDPPPVSAPL